MCVHGTSCFICTLSASAFMHWTIPRFLFRKSFYGDLISFFFDKNLLTICYAVPPTYCGWCIHVCWQMASNSQYSLPPQSSPQENASGKSQLRSKQRADGPSPESFLTIGGCFEHYMYRVTTLGWLKKKERKKEKRKKWTNLTFDCFRFATLK